MSKTKSDAEILANVAQASGMDSRVFMGACVDVVQAVSLKMFIDIADGAEHLILTTFEDVRDGAEYSLILVKSDKE